jgi:hypothetical protein
MPTEVAQEKAADVEQNPSPEQAKRALLGTWESTLPPGTAKSIRCVKHITPTHWTWVAYDRDTKVAFSACGGTWALIGDHRGRGARETHFPICVILRCRAGSTAPPEPRAAIVSRRRSISGTCIFLEAARPPSTFISGQATTTIGRLTSLARLALWPLVSPMHPALTLPNEWPGVYCSSSVSKLGRCTDRYLSVISRVPQRAHSDWFFKPFRVR